MWYWRVPVFIETVNFQAALMDAIKGLRTENPKIIFRHF